MGRRSEQGVAIVLVVWLVALLAIFAGSFAVTSRTEAQMAFNALEQARARHLADAAVVKGLYELLNSERDNAWRWDGTAYAVALDGGEASASIIDEKGKVDLNAAPVELLQILLLAAGASDEASVRIADAIADWRDEDDLARLNGAEGSDYRDARATVLPSDALFRAVSEARWVLGMDEALFDRLEPLATVYSLSPSLDPESAPRDLLQALPGLAITSVDELIETRVLSEAERADAGFDQFVSQSVWLSRASGPVFTVTGSASLPSGARATRRTVVWVVDRVRADYRILESQPVWSPKRGGD